MKRNIIAVLLLISTNLFSQDVAVLMKEASNFERTLKDDEAVGKYKQVLAADPDNLSALVRSSELMAGIGARQTDKNIKKQYYDQALALADKALALNPNSADANYVRAVAAGKQTEVESENKKIVAAVRDIKLYADKALNINPDHGKANYVLGKWNFEIVTLNWAKKAALKVLFGGMPDGTIENAIKYMEKSRSLEPYFVADFLDLAKAYKYDNQPAKAIEVLNQLVRLPTRTSNDVALKAEGKTMLAEMQ